MSEYDISQKIRDLRARYNLTLEQVAQRVGVGKSTIRKWETGMIENMRRDKIAKLAEALYTSPAYLMGWEEAASCEQSGYWDGRRLADLRASYGYSENQISTLLGISEEEYKQLEIGTIEPSFSLMLRLADAFSCDLDYICHRTARTSTAAPKHSAEEKLLIKKYRALSEDMQIIVQKTLDACYSSSSGEEAPPVAKNA